MAYELSDGITQKLIRADAHHTEIMNYLTPFNLGSADLVPERGKQNTLVVRVDLQPKSSSKLSAIIGDFLFAMRCTLDHLIGAIALRHGQEITHSHMFPLQSKPQEFKKEVEKRLKGVPSSAQGIIEGFQLYPENRGNDPLRWLSHLHNIDKHRRLNVITTTILESGAIVIGPDCQVNYSPAIVRDGALLPTFPTQVSLDEQPITDSVMLTCSLSVVFEEKALGLENSNTTEVVAVLNDISEYVRNVILPKLKPFFD